MVFAVALNVFQFRAIDEDTRHNYRAVHAYETADVFEIAISQDNSSRQLVAPFHYLGELFPGSKLLIPQGGIGSWFPFEESALAFGRVYGIRRIAYDPVDVISLDDVAEYRVPTVSFVPSRGSTQRIVGERVAYFVAPTPSSRQRARTFIVVTPEGAPRRTQPLAFVDIELLDASLRRELGIP